MKTNELYSQQTQQSVQSPLCSCLSQGKLRIAFIYGRLFMIEGV